MKQYLYLLCSLLFILTLTSSGCKRDGVNCGASERAQYLLKDDLAKLIYKGTEKLTFIDSNSNSTHVFVGNGYVTDYGIAYTQDECATKYNLERKYVTFQSSTFQSPINVSLYYPAGIDGLAYVQVDFNGSSFSEAATSIRSPFTYDSLMIRNKTYYDVRYFYGCYYNLTQGILKMETWDGHKWELLKIDTL